MDVHKVRVMVETDARAASDTDAQPVADAPIPTAAAPLAEGIEEPIFRHVEEVASYAVSDGSNPTAARRRRPGRMLCRMRRRMSRRKMNPRRMRLRGGKQQPWRALKGRRMRNGNR